MSEFFKASPGPLVPSAAFETFAEPVACPSCCLRQQCCAVIASLLIICSTHPKETAVCTRQCKSHQIRLPCSWGLPRNHWAGRIMPIPKNGALQKLPWLCPSGGHRAAGCPASCGAGEESTGTQQARKTELIVPTDVRLFSLNKRSPDCCEPLAGVQHSENVGSDVSEPGFLLLSRKREFWEFGGPHSTVSADVLEYSFEGGFQITRSALPAQRPLAGGGSRVLALRLLQVQMGCERNIHTGPPRIQ